MHRAHQHARARTRDRRHRLANEAARLMSEGGIHDYQLAKRKAAERLGIHDDASLPRNSEIELALREYQRLFRGPAQADALRRRRDAALEAMEFLSAFQPRLAGPVLEGTADDNSPVVLQLHVDDPDSVPRFLAEHQIPADAGSRRLRLDRDRTAEFPIWAFSAEGLPFELVVLPAVAVRQAPLSPVDERPMQRASAAQLRRLLEDEQAAPTAPPPWAGQGPA